MLLAFTTLLAQAAVDPLTLPIGPPGLVEARMGYTDTSTGRQATPAEIAAAADGLRFVFVGESHDSLAHHQAQAAIIDALVARGRDVVVGFEMFTRDNQPNLDGWTLGAWDREEFIEKSNWASQWGMDFALYEPVFLEVREHALPMVALNVPRDWVRAVGRQGPAALTPEQRKWVPTIDTGNRAHRKVFEALIGGHPLAGERGENMYAAQVTWDEGMARSALDYMGARRNPNLVMVVIAGAGHTMYGQGINWRVTRETGERTLNVVAIDADAPRSVSRGLADFVFAAPPPPREAR